MLVGGGGFGLEGLRRQAWRGERAMDGAAGAGRVGGLADWQIGPVAVRKRADVSKTPVTAVNGPGRQAQ